MERRRSKRFNVVNLELFNNDTKEHVGKVINISKGGLLVTADQEFKPGEIHPFFIPFTQTVNGEIKFDFEAKIIWCRPNPLSSAAYSIGIEFSTHPELQTMFIQQLVKIYGVN